VRCRYWNDPEVLKKLGSAMGDSMEGFPGMGAGQMPPGFPTGAVENGTAAAAAKEADGDGDADGEAEEPTVHSAASTGALRRHAQGMLLLHIHGHRLEPRPVLQAAAAVWRHYREIFCGQVN
jgi:hypothetical protein